MKTLVLLLLLAAAIGAAYWKTQRPDDGIAELRADAMSAVDRLRTGFNAVRDGATADTPTTDPQAEDALTAEALAAEMAVRTNQAELSETRTALNARIDKLENDLAQTLSASDADAVQDRLDAVESQLQSADTHLAAIGDTPAELEDSLQRLSSFEGRLNLLGRRQDESDADNRLEELAQRVDEMFTTIESLSAIASRSADTSAESVAILSDRVSTLDARLNTLAAGGAASADGAEGEAQANGLSLDAATDQRIAALESKLEIARANSLRVDALNNRYEQLEQQLGEASAADESLRSALGELELGLGELSTSTDALSIDSVQQEIREQLANLDAEVDTEGAADVADLTDSLETTRERIQALETRVQDLPASSSAAGDAQQTQSALEAQIAALERRLESLPATPSDPALVDSLSEVRERVDELSTRDFVTQEDLRAQAVGKSVEYKIYFDKNSTGISDDAARVLDSFIAQETNRTTGVAIYGFTDRAGPATYNQELAQRRATAVRSYLIQNGFDFTKIGNVSGLGEDAAAALLEDEQEDAQQRVVVLFASQL